jgi:hypothetical protein
MLPDVHFGNPESKPIDWRKYDDDSDDGDNDEELKETPASVIALLGFDPKDE